MSDLTNRVEAWEELFASPAWKEFETVLRAQIDTRAQVILREPLMADGIYDREMIRGERNGLELALVIAETILEQARVDVTNAAKELNNEQTAI